MSVSSAYDKGYERGLNKGKELALASIWNFLEKIGDSPSNELKDSIKKFIEDWS